MAEQTAARLDHKVIDGGVTETLLKLGTGQYNLGVVQAGQESEKLVLAELEKQGFGEAELAAIQATMQKATFASVAETAIQEEEDVTLMVMALQAKADELGKDYEKLGTRNEEELARVRAVKEILDTANAELLVAQKPGGWWRESRIEKAKAAAVEAETAFQAVEVETLAAARARLRKENWDVKFQRYLFQALGVRDIMQHRLDTIIIPGIELVETKLADTYQQRANAAGTLHSLAREIKTVEKELSMAKADLGQYNQQTEPAEYAEADKKYNELKAKLLTLTEDNDVALSTLQKMEAAVHTHEEERVALLQLRKAQRILINVLTKTTEERMVSFKIALDVLKVGADQERSADITKIGEELDISNLERIMSIGHSAQRTILEMFERHPDQMMKIAQLQQASVREHLAEHERYEVLARHAQERYGIDIMAGLYDPAGVSNKAS